MGLIISNIKKFRPLVLGTMTALAILPACDRRDDQEKIQSAEREAQKKVNEAQKESTTKITSAQQDMNQQVAEANGNLAKDRDDYRSKLQSQLDDADNKITQMEAKEKTATTKTKMELDSLLPEIHAKRDALRTDMKQLENATVSNWDTTKMQLDHDATALKNALDRAPGLRTPSLSPMNPNAPTPMP